MSSGVDRLTAELRRWAGRPARLSPAAARSRVLARLPHGPARPAWRFATVAGAAAALAAALLAGALLDGRDAEPPAAAAPVTARAERVIVHQLSSGTPLYIVVRPGTAGHGS